MSCSLPTPRAPGRCRSDRVAGHPGNDRRSSLAEGRRDLDRALLVHVAAGKPLLGICGGFQMLGPGDFATRTASKVREGR
ncbi:predicted protein [Mycobacterium tuberculosis GM 1503]|nr:predicted protein [Mycobacterium tuberculosis GM 1503]